MPYPAPAIFQFLRCSSVACSSFGYQARGTEMIRPSFRATESESAENVTFATRSSALNPKIPLPFLLKLMPMLFSLWGLYRIAVLGAAALHYWLNSDPCCLAGRKPTAAGATFWRCSRD